jgi:hypothetical protein
VRVTESSNQAQPLLVLVDYRTPASLPSRLNNLTQPAQPWNVMQAVSGLRSLQGVNFKHDTHRPCILGHTFAGLMDKQFVSSLELVSICAGIWLRNSWQAASWVTGGTLIAQAPGNSYLLPWFQPGIVVMICQIGLHACHQTSATTSRVKSQTQDWQSAAHPGW